MKGSELSFGLTARSSGLSVVPRNRSSGLSGMNRSKDARSTLAEISGVRRQIPDDEAAELGRKYP